MTRLLTPRRTLALVLICYVVLALLVAVLTPPWEANDEPDHVQNIETLVGGRFYDLRPGSGAEAHQPPLYYLGLAAWQRIVGVPGFTPRPVAACNGFLQRCHQTFRHDLPRDGADQRRVAFLRLPGIGLGVLTVLLTWLAAGRLSRDPWTPVVAAATAAFVPRFVFLTGVVNNDNLACALGAGLIALALALVVSRSSSRRRKTFLAAGAGAIAGALLLTKLTALSLVPGVALALCLAARGRRETARLLAVAVGVALLVSSPWLIHNLAVHGDPLAVTATRDYLRDTLSELIFSVGPATEVLFSRMPNEIFKGYWYRSGWGYTDWSWWAYVPFWVVAAGAVAGVVVARRRDYSAVATTVLAVLFAAPVAMVWLLGLDTTTAQARWALVGLPALAILVALGAERWSPHVAPRFAVAIIGMVGTVIAIRQDIAPLRPNALLTATTRSAPEVRASHSDQGGLGLHHQTTTAAPKDRRRGGTAWVGGKVRRR